MSPTTIERFPTEFAARLRFVLCDVDDTLTLHGQLYAETYRALESLHQAGLVIIPITGGPAGWCDLMARIWPVDGVIGENGAFHFHYDRRAGRLIRQFWASAAERESNRARLGQLARQIVEQVPGCRVSGDQAYREADLAIDYAQDVTPLSRDAVQRIVELFETAGAKARASSIHVNGWFGDYDKLKMALRMLEERYQVTPEQAREQVLFVGDAPNDATMFEFFPLSAGVANVRPFLDQLPTPPRWITRREGGLGFAELTRLLIRARGSGPQAL
jgi:HAD superfamily hydrolase (TIGR01484 family)